jgi:hypothetical protein
MKRSGNTVLMTGGSTHRLSPHEFVDALGQIDMSLTPPYGDIELGKKGYWLLGTAPFRGGCCRRRHGRRARASPGAYLCCASISRCSPRVPIMTVLLASGNASAKKRDPRQS